MPNNFSPHAYGKTLYEWIIAHTEQISLTGEAVELSGRQVYNQLVALGVIIPEQQVAVLECAMKLSLLRLSIKRPSLDQKIRELRRIYAGICLSEAMTLALGEYEAQMQAEHATMAIEQAADDAAWAQLQEDHDRFMADHSYDDREG